MKKKLNLSLKKKFFSQKFLKKRFVEHYLLTIGVCKNQRKKYQKVLVSRHWYVNDGLQGTLAGNWGKERERKCVLVCVCALFSNNFLCDHFGFLDGIMQTFPKSLFLFYE